MQRILKMIVMAGALAVPAFARGQAADDKAPPYTPKVPVAPTPGTKPDPSEPTPVQPSLTAEQVEQIVDAAVTRAMARQQANQPPTPSPSGQQQQAQASPQQQQATASPQQQAIAYQPVVAQPQQQYALQQTTMQQAQVLVPAGKFKQHLAALGQHLVNCGQPHIKTMTLAPVAYTTSPAIVPVATTTQIVSVPAAAQPVLTYTPSIPAAPATYYPPQQALAAPPKAPKK